MEDPGGGNTKVDAPFPWFGGKRYVAARLWQVFGNVANYVEPFAGSLAVLLQRPYPPQLETVNDKDAFLTNVWRALQADPEAVAHWCAFPVHEAQQHAVHTWLVNQRTMFTARLMGDPDYYDAKVAGWWLYGINCWIGSGWCQGKGAWSSVEGQFVRLAHAGRGVHRQRVHLGNTGLGVHRKRVHLGEAKHEGLSAWFAALQRRLRRVRVCCGEWTRVLSPSVTTHHGITAVLLDPPYSLEEGRSPNLYVMDDTAIAHTVRAWCVTHGTNPLLRIALCGYGTVHHELLMHGWRTITWTANGGFGNRRQQGHNPNRTRETIWLSPACLTTDSEGQLPLFAQGT